MNALQAILNDTERVSAIVGAYAVARAKRSFKDQVGPDGKAWPARYPNQESDYLNVAGALEDLRSGGRIKNRRYENRPAGRDTGALMSGIRYRVNGNVVTIGSNVDYADRFQYGGKSEIPLDAALIQRIRKAIGKGKRRNAVLQKRLGPVLGVWRRGGRVWVTESPPRQFAGLTQQDSTDIANAIYRAGGVRR